MINSAGKYLGVTLAPMLGASVATEAFGFNTPLRRSGTPDEVADLIAFLASDESRYITGEVIIIDGGNALQEYKGPIESYY